MIYYYLFYVLITISFLLDKFIDINITNYKKLCEFNFIITYFNTWTNILCYISYLIVIYVIAIDINAVKVCSPI